MFDLPKRNHEGMFLFFLFQTLMHGRQEKWALTKRVCFKVDEIWNRIIELRDCLEYPRCGPPKGGGCFFDRTLSLLGKLWEAEFWRDSP